MADVYNPSGSPGYRWDLEDKDRLYAGGALFATPAGVTIPDEIDARPWLPTKNQSTMGSCRGHSGSTGGTFIYHGILRKYINFSPMWLYLRTQKRDGLLGSDNGSTIENGVKVMLEEGLCREEVFPYPNPARYSTRIPPDADEDAAKYKFGRYSPCDSFEQYLQWTGTGQGYCDIGVRFPFQHNNGLVTSWRPTGNGGHAMPVCGYINRPGVGRVAVLFNSHSESSGDKGEFYFTEAAFNAMCRDQYSSVICVSDMTTVQARIFLGAGSEPIVGNARLD